jgi:hypothetical protein
MLTIPPVPFTGIVQKLADNGPAVVLAGGFAYLLFRQYSQGVTKMFDFLSLQILQTLKDIRDELEEIKRK